MDRILRHFKMRFQNMIDFLKMHQILIPKNVLKTFKIKLAKSIFTVTQSLAKLRKCDKSNL
jgi:hypothetical protein